MIDTDDYDSDSSTGTSSSDDDEDENGVYDPDSPLDTLVLGQNYPHFIDKLCEDFHTLKVTDSPSTDMRKVIQDIHVYSFINEIDIFVHPSLPDALVADSPPPIEFFKALPHIDEMDNDVRKDHFLVYVLVLENDKNKPVIAIGSGAALAEGCRGRLRNYKDDYMLPTRVAELIRNHGYTITHHGILALMPYRQLALQSMPYALGWAKLLEAMYTFVFWSIHQAPGKLITDHYLGHLCPSNCSEMPYLGANTHSPLWERIMSLAATPEELIETTMMAKAREIARLKDSRVALNALERGELDGNDPKVVERVQPAVNERARKKRCRAKKPAKKTEGAKNRRSQALKDSRVALKAFERGELDKNDPDVLKKIELALNDRARRKRFDDKRAGKKSRTSLSIESDAESDSDVDMDLPNSDDDEI